MAFKGNTRCKNRVRQLRINRGLEQKDLCQILDIKQSSLSEIELNSNKPGDEILVRMYDRLGWTPGDILYIEPESA